MHLSQVKTQYVSLAASRLLSGLQNAKEEMQAQMHAAGQQGDASGKPSPRQTSKKYRYKKKTE